MERAERFRWSLTEEGRYRLLVDAVIDYAIYMLDPDGYVTSWNPGAARIKGYSEAEILGQHFSRFYTEEDRQSGLPARALATAAREGRFQNEGWRVRKDGTRFWASVIVDPIYAPTGELVGFAKITRDITDRHEAQRALEEAREAFFQAQKMEAIGQLTGGVAHDFNNLLMAILGSLELLKKRLPDDPRIVRLVDNAMQAGQRGASLTQRMLAFARRQELSPEAVDLPSLVRGMTELLERSLGPGVTIETRFPLGLAPVRADANQLELALLNLAVNARDAMPGGGSIIIAARQEEIGPGHPTGLKPGRYVCLSVHDTGEGMDEATLSRAAEPFFTTKGVGKGTGLGLSMVHGMAEQSEGRLVLKSRKGEGTTAEIWLPSARARRRVVQEDAPPEVKADVRLPRSLAVLAVDDDNLVLVNTAALLDDLGYTVLQASSGEEALGLLRRGEKVDVVITDQAMPQMTGTQLAEEIGRSWPDLPVILATGYADLPRTDTRLPKLSKPFTQVDLDRAIDEAVRSSAPTAERSHPSQS